MHRLEFLKSSALIAGGSLLGCNSNKPAEPAPLNWAGNIVFSTANVFKPSNVDELAAFVKKTDKLKAQGTRHCFNRIADSKDQLVSMTGMNKLISIDEVAQTAKVEAGIKYGELAPLLQEKGYALHNLASLPHISVAGSIATATHGSGVNNGNLASIVKGIEFINAKGDLVSLSEKDGDEFYGAVVGLGALGVVTSVTLKLQPAFSVYQWVYENLPISELEKNFETIMSAAYSVSLFTDYQKDSINEVWLKFRHKEGDDTNQPATYMNAVAATKDMHPIAALSAEHCTPQMGVVGPWYERLPHFKMGFTPSSGKELQTEYFVPFENAMDAFKAIAAMSKDIGPHLQISEIRSIAADDLWLSMAYKRKSIAFHFTWKQENDAVAALMPRIEKALAPFNPRPHWGKLFTLTRGQLSNTYTRMAEFRALAEKHDPTGKFRNDFLQQNLWG
ncbi:MAG TPA: D-arabinono-1,4-lactone oxidase [Chitinophagaceae bacterium]|nr:D-arabinono-1,4-lactone oxidase [Chitinophagaceae bacterium]